MKQKTRKFLTALAGYKTDTTVNSQKIKSAFTDAGATVSTDDPRTIRITYGNANTLFYFATGDKTRCHLAADQNAKRIVDLLFARK